MPYSILNGQVRWRTVDIKIIFEKTLSSLPQTDKIRDSAGAIQVRDGLEIGAMNGSKAVNSDMLETTRNFWPLNFSSRGSSADIQPCVVIRREGLP